MLPTCTRPLQELDVDVSKVGTATDPVDDSGASTAQLSARWCDQVPNTDDEQDWSEAYYGKKAPAWQREGRSPAVSNSIVPTSGDELEIPNTDDELAYYKPRERWFPDRAGGARRSTLATIEGSQSPVRSCANGGLMGTAPPGYVADLSPMRNGGYSPWADASARSPPQVQAACQQWATHPGTMPAQTQSLSPVHRSSAIHDFTGGPSCHAHSLSPVRTTRTTQAFQSNFHGGPQNGQGIAAPTQRPSLLNWNTAPDTYDRTGSLRQAQGLQQHVDIVAYPRAGQEQRFSGLQVQTVGIRDCVDVEAENSDDGRSPMRSKDSTGCESPSPRRKERLNWNANVVTVMVRQIPRRFTQSAFVDELHQRGFKGLFDFIYLPCDRTKGVNVGYCFINFTEPKHAQCFRKAMSGIYLDDLMRMQGKPICVHPAARQGYLANYQHFAQTKIGQDTESGPLFLGSGTNGAPVPSAGGPPPPPMQPPVLPQDLQQPPLLEQQEVHSAPPLQSPQGGSTTPPLVQRVPSHTSQTSQTSQKGMQLSLEMHLNGGHSPNSPQGESIHAVAVTPPSTACTWESSQEAATQVRANGNFHGQCQKPYISPARTPPAVGPVVVGTPSVIVVPLATPIPQAALLPADEGPAAKQSEDVYCKWMDLDTRKANQNNSNNRNDNESQGATGTPASAESCKPSMSLPPR